jgi:SAM-dependent methyltransferase
MIELEMLNILPSGTHREKGRLSPTRLGPMHGPDGLQYGREWGQDSFDFFADNFLIKKLSTDSAGKSCLDIGCGTGSRIKDILKLNLFEAIYGCDIQPRKQFRAVSDSVTDSSKGKTIEFVKKSVVNIGSDDFSGIKFDYINCRNVGHFLSPNDFRTAIRNIAALSIEGALVTLSFDDADDKPFPVSLLEHDIPDFYKAWKPCPHGAAYANYGGPDVEDFMKEVGFEILPLVLDPEFSTIRETEYHIAALAPGPRNTQFSTNRKAASSGPHIVG